MNSGLTSHQQRGHPDKGLGLKSHPKDLRSEVGISIILLFHSKNIVTSN